jgi:chemotaxis protein MotB
MLKLSQLRGRLKEEDEGTWFISLADLLTLLLCFFVLMVSVSQFDQDRYKKVAQSLEESLKAETAKREAEQAKNRERERPLGFSLKQDGEASGQLYPVVRPALPPQVYQTPPGPNTQPPAEAGPRQQPKTLDELGAELGQKLASADHLGIQVEKRDAGYAVTLKGAVLFDLGSTELKPASIPYLDSIAATLRGAPYKVIVEGHTDNLPIQSFVYPSNWELSAARAARVARYLIDRGVSRERIQVVGLADTKPLVPNDNAQGQHLPENQARNRRVVVLINP